MVNRTCKKCYLKQDHTMMDYSGMLNGYLCKKSTQCEKRRKERVDGIQGILVGEKYELKKAIGIHKKGTIMEIIKETKLMVIVKIGEFELRIRKGLVGKHH